MDNLMYLAAHSRPPSSSPLVLLFFAFSGILYRLIQVAHAVGVCLRKARPLLVFPCYLALIRISFIHTTLRATNNE